MTLKSRFPSTETGLSPSVTTLYNRGRLAKLDLSDGKSLYTKLVVIKTFAWFKLKFIYNLRRGMMSMAKHFPPVSYGCGSLLLFLTVIMS